MASPTPKFNELSAVKQENGLHSTPQMAPPTHERNETNDLLYNSIELLKIKPNWFAFISIDGVTDSTRIRAAPYNYNNNNNNNNSNNKINTIHLTHSSLPSGWSPAGSRRIAPLRGDCLPVRMCHLFRRNRPLSAICQRSTWHLLLWFFLLFLLIAEVPPPHCCHCWLPPLCHRGAIVPRGDKYLFSVINFLRISQTSMWIQSCWWEEYDGISVWFCSCYQWWLFAIYIDAINHRRFDNSKSHFLQLNLTHLH